MVGGKRRKSALDRKDSESPRCEYDGYLCAVESSAGAAGLGAQRVENVGGGRSSTNTGGHKEKQKTIKINLESNFP